MTTPCLNLIHKESMNVKKNVLYATICVALYKMKIMTIYFTYREINNLHLFMNEESLVASPIMRLTNPIAIYFCSKSVIVRTPLCNVRLQL